MASPPRFRTSPVLLTLLAGLAAGPALAQAQTCDEFKEKLAAKIRGNGVTAFDLFVLPKEESTPWKIIGTCNGGRSKIAYARGTAHEQAETLRAAGITPKEKNEAAAAPAARAPAPDVRPPADKPAPGAASTPASAVPTARVATPAPAPAATPPLPRTASAPTGPTSAPPAATGSPPAASAPKAPTVAAPVAAPSSASTAPPAPAAAPPVAAAQPSPAQAATPAAAKLATAAPPSSATPTPDTKPGATPPPNIWAQGEQRQCHMVKPKGWSTDRTLYGSSAKPPAPGAAIDHYEADILPPSDDALAKKGLVFSFQIRPHYVYEMRPAVMAAYPSADAFNAMVKKAPASLSGQELDFRHSLDAAEPTNAEEWKRTRAVAPSPGVIDGVGVVRLQFIQNDNWKPIEPFSFRAREQGGKDAATIATQRISAWSDGVALRAQAVVNPLHRSPDGGGPLADRLVYEYGCWASNEMSPAEFTALCGAYIERSTVGPDFPAAHCVAAADGIAFAPR